MNFFAGLCNFFNSLSVTFLPLIHLISVRTSLRWNTLNLLLAALNIEPSNATCSNPVNPAVLAKNDGISY